MRGPEEEAACEVAVVAVVDRLSAAAAVAVSVAAEELEGESDEKVEIVLCCVGLVAQFSAAISRSTVDDRREISAPALEIEGVKG